MAGDAASDSKKRKNAPSATPAKSYSVNEVVWAKDSGRLYKAKVLQVEQGGAKYFLHYQGWSPKWDKWVDEADLMPDGKEAQDMAKKLEVPKAAAVKKAQGEKKAGAARKKPRMDVKKDIEDDSGVAQVKLTIPFSLKKQLVTDWEFVTQEPKLLVPLPRKISVAQLMNNFMETKKKNEGGSGTSAGEGGGAAGKGGKKGSSSGGAGGSAANVQNIARFQELLDGLKIYFDKALPLILLYRQERNQYEKIILKHPGKAPSELYGAEHLLRLFVKLPTLLAQTALSPQEITQVQSKVGEFLRFIQKGQAEYFIQQYETEEASAEDA